MGDLHVFQNEYDWVIAESEEDAWAVWCAWSGEKREDYADDKFEQLPDDERLRIWHEDNNPVDCGCSALAELDKIERNKPFNDWLALKKLIESQGGRFNLHVPPRIETGRRFDPNGHSSDCPKGFEEKTCAEWAASDGRGFLCTTEY